MPANTHRKPTRRGRFFVACAALLTLTATPRVQAQVPAQEPVAGHALRLCLPDFAVPPYLSAPGEPAGTAQRLLHDSAQALGLDLQEQRQPVRRCRYTMSLGEAELTLASPTPENLDELRFPMRDGRVDTSRVLLQIELVWVKRRGDAYAWDGRALRGGQAQPLVGVRSSLRSVQEPLRARGFRLDEQALSGRQLLRKLQAGRVELAAGMRGELEPLLREPEFRALELIERPLARIEIYLAAAAKLDPAWNPRLERWWQEIARRRDTPPYAAP